MTDSHGQTPTAAIAIDEAAIQRISMAREVSTAWLDDLASQDIAPGLRTAQIGRIFYVLGDGSDVDSKLLVIPTTEAGILQEHIPREYRPEAFRRVVRAALSLIIPTVTIPTSWRPWHHGSRVSFQSNSFSSRCNARILLDSHPEGTDHLFAQEIPASVKNLDDANLLTHVVQLAATSYKEALNNAKAGDPDSDIPTAFGIDLHDVLTSELTRGHSLEDWYESRLTIQQRRFVDLPLTQPVRLRGPAGSGKTLALVVKFLKSVYEACDYGKSLSLIFLTHSMSTVDVVRQMLIDLDSRGALHDPGCCVKWKVTTLQAIANDAMQYDLVDLKPLSNDGLEGRILQMEAIDAVINRFRETDWPMWKARCSQRFQALLGSEKASDLRK